MNSLINFYKRQGKLALLSSRKIVRRKEAASVGMLRSYIRIGFWNRGVVDNIVRVRKGYNIPCLRLKMDEARRLEERDLVEMSRRHVLKTRVGDVSMPGMLLKQRKVQSNNVSARRRVLKLYNVLSSNGNHLRVNLLLDKAFAKMKRFFRKRYCSRKKFLISNQEIGRLFFFYNKYHFFFSRFSLIDNALKKLSFGFKLKRMKRARTVWDVPLVLWPGYRLFQSCRWVKEAVLSRMYLAKQRRGSVSMTIIDAFLAELLILRSKRKWKRRRSLSFRRLLSARATMHAYYHRFDTVHKFSTSVRGKKDIVLKKE